MKILTKITLLFVIIAITVVNTSHGFSITELSGTAVTNSDALEFGGKIITIITTLGSVLSVIVLIVIGIKYMVGGIEQKAEYKRTLMPYVIGCILLFAASSIAGAVYQIAPK